MHRRSFLSLSALAAPTFAREKLDIAAVEKPRVLRAANAYLKQPPVTITATSSSRSAGGPHDYFSEGDYWWPDPKNPDGPYIQRDGMSNPGNFDAHRQALLRLSVQMPALTAAWRITHQRRYAEHAAAHLRAWFVDESTRMNPNLQFAQAIHGRATGRGTGIIDTIHLVEVARAASTLETSDVVNKPELDGIRNWFATYLEWINTHPYGLQERDAKNNHGTCWVMQAAEFARFTGNREVSAWCRERFQSALLPIQMGQNGAFPLELQRTKPYSYSLFNLEAMATLCRILSTSEHDLWRFQLPDGRGMRKGMDFIYPYIADKSKWPYPPDIMYFDQWPLRQVSLLFAGIAFGDSRYLDLWGRLNPDPTVEEAIRNYPIRQPVLWLTLEGNRWTRLEW